MKIIEPLSSALLLTGCVYSAGISQNSAFMHYFGISPAFSQPAIDKIFYDGGLITFEIFVWHIAAIFAVMFSVAAVTVIWSFVKNVSVRQAVLSTLATIARSFDLSKGFAGVFSLIYLIALTLLSYEKGQSDGEKIAETFLDTCHAVVIDKGARQIKGCAFNKDRDSIWYYTIEGETPKASSKLLSELDQVTYLAPFKLY